MSEEVARPPVTWTVAAGALAVLGVLSLASLVPLLSLPGLLPKGPAAVDPHIGEELVLLFSSEVIVNIQRALHAGGIVLFLAVAFVLIRTRLASPIAPLAAVTLAGLGASLFAHLAGLPQGDLLERVVGSVTAEALPGFWSSVAGISTLAFLSTFPDGRWQPSWARWLVAAAVVVWIGSLLLPGGFPDPRTWPVVLRWIWLVGMPAVAMLAQVERARRTDFRPGRPVVLSLVAAIGVFVLLWALQPELQPDSLGLVVATPRLRAVYAVNLLVLLTTAVFMFPVTVSFAIIRNRLFDLDLFVNRALVYGTVTTLIGGVFLGVAALVVGIAGGRSTSAFDSGPGLLGVLLGTVIVLTFQPVRRQVQAVVDRRFFRRRYDAGQVIERFARYAASLVDPRTLEKVLESTVKEALGPVHTRLHQDQALVEANLPPFDTSRVADLGNVEHPVLDPIRANGAEVLVPLVAGGSVNGVLELGRRSSGARYSALDLDLLDRLARAAGPALQLAHQMKAREQEAQQRERLSHELDLARKIQRDLLPHRVPEIDGWQFDALYRPAQEVGGDFYDWVTLPDGRLAVVIGDVSDKGIPAALVMATCRTLLRVSALSGGPPGEVLAEVNERLQPDIPAAMFVTCLYAVLDPASGAVVLANAGHNLPIRRAPHLIEEIVARGMPLGLMSGMTYEEVETHLDVGEGLVLTSDGLSEAHDDGGDMFGTARIRAAIDGTGDVIESVLSSHLEFVGRDWAQEDDITLVTAGRSDGGRSTAV